MVELRQQQNRKLDVSTAVGSIGARVALPSRPAPGLPPLIALHGIARNAEAIFVAFAQAAEKTGRVVVVPRFSRRHWPEFQRIGRARPDRALLSLLGALRVTGAVPCGPVDLFGFSGGAQLAHRFAMLYPHRIGRLHLASAGWYCLPDPAIRFPAGLRDAKKAPLPGTPNFAALKRDQIEAFLRLSLRVYVGSADTARDPALRSSPRLDAVQGPHRRARAETFVARFNSAAIGRGIVPDTELILLPGCGHDFSQCATESGLAARVLS